MLLSGLKSRNAPRTQVVLQRKAELLNELTMDPLISLHQCREVIGCSYSTLNRLLASGVLKKWQPGGRGQRKVRQSELQKFLAAGDAHV